MYAKAVHLGVDAGFQPILYDNVAIDRSGIERAVQLAGTVIRDRTKQGAGGVGGLAVARYCSTRRCLLSSWTV